MGRRTKRKEAQKKPLVPVILVIVLIGLIAGGGFKIIQSIYLEEPPAITDNSEDTTSSQPTDTEETNNEEDIDSTEPAKVGEKVEIKPVNPQKKEIIVEGTIEDVDYQTHTVQIKQELDDNSVKVDGTIVVREDAVVSLKGVAVEFSQLARGDYVTLVLDANRQARAVDIYR